MEIFIPQFVRTALDRLNECGYEGYIVGGCVRDSLLGKKPHDYDVCTNCTPDKMLEVFANFRTIENGLKHGHAHCFDRERAGGDNLLSQ